MKKVILIAPAAMCACEYTNVGKERVGFGMEKHIRHLPNRPGETPNPAPTDTFPAGFEIQPLGSKFDDYM